MCGDKNIKMFQKKLKQINWDILEARHVNEVDDLFQEKVSHPYCESFQLKRLFGSKAKNKKWLQSCSIALKTHLLLNGRFQIPKTPKQDRICAMCNSNCVENEFIL